MDTFHVSSWIAGTLAGVSLIFCMIRREPSVRYLRQLAGPALSKFSHLPPPSLDTKLRIAASELRRGRYLSISVLYWVLILGPALLASQFIECIVHTQPQQAILALTTAVVLAVLGALPFLALQRLMLVNRLYEIERP
jgi:hypothetical protein